MPRTAEVVFRVFDAATGPMKKIVAGGDQVDKTMKGASKSLDDLDSTKNRSSISNVGRDIEGLGRKSNEMANNVNRSTTSAGRSFEQMRNKGAKSLNELTVMLDKFKNEKAEAKVDVDITKAEAKIRLIKQQIRSVATTQARSELKALGLDVEALAGGLAGGGGGGPPGLRGGMAGGGGGLAGALKDVVSGLGLMGVAMVVALPAVVALAGAISALIGSLGAAALGAGAVGVGVFGAVAVGIGAIAAVAVPAVKEIGKVKKAQDAYNKSVQQYGRDSAQAVKAHKALVDEQKKDPGAGGVLRNASALNNRWRQATGPARQDFFGILNAGLEGAMKLLPDFGRVADQVMNSAREAVKGFVATLTTPEMRGVLRTMGDTFSRAIGPAMSGLGQLATFFARVARAASPIVIQLFEAFNRWATGLADSASNAGKVQGVIISLVDHTKAWWDFLKAAVNLMTSFFGSGAQQGKSMLQGMTDQLDKWAEWIRDNPDKMHAFFNRTIDAAQKLAGALAEIAKTLAEIADGMMPLLNLASTVVGGAGQTNMLGPLAAYGGYRYLRAKGHRQEGGKQLANTIAETGAVPTTGAGAAAGEIDAAAIASRTVTRGTGGKSGGLLRRALSMGGRETALSGALYGMGGGTAAGPGRLVTGLAAGALSKHVGEEALHGAATRIGGRLLGGVVRKAGPVAAAMAAYDMIASGGSLGHRVGNTVNNFGFGLPGLVAPGLFGGDPGPQITPEQRAQSFVQQHPHIQQQRAQATHLQHLLSARTAMPGQFDYRSGTAVQRTRLALQGNTREKVQKELDALKPVVNAEIKLQGAAQASKSLDDVIGAFDIRWQHAGSKLAEKGLFKDIKVEAARLGPAGRSSFRTAVASWTAQLENGTPHQRKIARDLKEYIVGQFADMGKRVAVVNGQILTGTKSEWGKIAGEIGSRTEQALEEATTNFTKIQLQAVGSLTAMGFTPQQARALVQGMDATSSKRTQAAASGAVATKGTGGNIGNLASGALTATIPSASSQRASKKKARGGRLTGIGTADYLDVGGGNRAAPGELIVNQHTERKLDRRLGWPGATDFYTRNEHAPHNQQVFASGGRVDNFGGVTPGLTTLIRQLESMGFKHGSTTSGGHAAHSLHYQGEAVDWGDATNDMHRLWSVLYPRRAQFAELFGPSYLRKPTLMHFGQAFQDAALQQQHNDHIHVGLTGNRGRLPLGHGSNTGGRGGGGGANAAYPHVHLRTPHSALGGVPGALSDRATRNVAGALEQRINRKLDSMGGGGGVGDVGMGAFGGGGQLDTWLSRALRITGHYSPGNLRGLRTMAMGESGGNPNAHQQIHDINSTNGSGGAMGLLQTIPGTFKAYAMPGHNNIFNPVDNAIASIRYQFSKYGRIVGHAGYAMGGRLPGGQAPDFGGWFGNGGDFTVAQPTLIGVGEKGEERVRVRPAHDAPDRPIHISIGHITNHEEGDIRKILDREFSKAAVAIGNGVGRGDELDD